jgi:hypothetical protein
VPQPPSSALQGGSPEVTVLGEELRFVCGPASCRVAARYRIRAARAQRLQLEFILPTSGKVTVRHGARAFEVAARQAGEVPEAMQTMWFSPLPPLFKALFEVDFSLGDNELTVEYAQPLGEREIGHSYFSDGEMVKRWTYELWPLGEWRREKAMEIHISIDVPRKAPSWWQRTFSTYDALVCTVVPSQRADEAVPVRILQRRTRQQGQHLRYELQLSAEPDVPQRLICDWGKSKLIE